MIVFLAAALHCQSGTAQQSSLYMTKELKRAYENGTRSYDGQPGKNYFQNRTDYDIQVEFDPYSRLLTGKEAVTYTNNSPDTLVRTVINLYANILKKGATRKKSLNPDDAGDGMNVSRLVVNGSAFDLERNPPYLDGKNLIVRLPAPLPPGGTAEFEIDWQYTFQGNSNIREGRYHETTFFIAYWFPRIAVYDDIDGWDRHIYNAEQEFYHEYGDYNVSVTVPAEFYVWASGLLQNAVEVLSDREYRLFTESKTTDSIIPILTADSHDQGSASRKNQKKTWKFRAAYLPDFAFALSDTYLWDATSVAVGDKRVHVHAVYFRDSKDFHEVAAISRETIRLLSDSVMQVPFPYPQMTAFNGHFGMEFPMMVNDGDAANRNGTLFVTAHEIAHTYFPFWVGTNEHKYAWMDEGLITFLPKTIEDALSHDPDYRAFLANIRTYSHYAAGKYDAPPMMPSDQLAGMTYMYVSYSRSAVAFYVLQDILGNELFKKCLVSFIDRWAGKHPTAYDLFYTFEDVSGQDLGWFWQPWFFEFGYPDLSVNSVSEGEKGLDILIHREGGFPVPVNLLVTYTDGTQDEINQSASLWHEGAVEVLITLNSRKRVKTVEVNARTVPDVHSGNNRFDLE